MIAKKTSNKKNSHLTASYIIAGIVSLYNSVFANNTLAIIASGNISKMIAQRYRISAEKTACILDIFSCAMQGILPYGAQLLLAGKLSGVSVITLSLYGYYSFALLFVGIIYIKLSALKLQ